MQSILFIDKREREREFTKVEDRGLVLQSSQNSPKEQEIKTRLKIKGASYDLNLFLFII